MRSWLSSGYRSRTRTTPCARSAPLRKCAPIAEHGLEARIGVNTGQVVVGGQGETLVTGDAVNVAARLEQAAAPGEALMGVETRLLVRDAVRFEPVEPFALKGKSDPVEAFRLLEVVAGAQSLARDFGTPLVGRERERQRLWRDYEDVIADRTCRLFTLLGPAGIGKSRLVADFLDRVGSSAEVLRGRCLSYGDGITYWPLVEMLIAIDVEPDAVIGTSPPETQLAFRRLLEARAAERPQVVVIDDLQWSEPVFVDLVEHVADLSRDAPIFLLCVARTSRTASRWCATAPARSRRRWTTRGTGRESASDQERRHRPDRRGEADEISDDELDRPRAGGLRMLLGDRRLRPLGKEKAGDARRLGRRHEHELRAHWVRCG
jgi:AAA ATPase domain/Adenylate and Guanylate cyclase catalytic domain